VAVAIVVTRIVMTVATIQMVPQNDLVASEEASVETTSFTKLRKPFWMV
jgi:hypothetical protein